MIFSVRSSQRRRGMVPFRLVFQRAAGAFTLVELLVAILIIGLITTLVAAIASRGVYQQRKANTQAIMRGVTLAIEQFVMERPLHGKYGIRRVDTSGGQPVSIEPTFGDFPPYQLDGPNTAGNLNVRGIVEQNYLPGTGPRPVSLSRRLFEDLSPNPATTSMANFVGLDTADAKPNDDIRALYTYLRVFSSGTLNQIPPSAIKRLRPQASPEWVNPTGNGAPPNSGPANGAVDVLGIHDAWGVPLDYMLYVKLERYPRDDATRPVGWRVVDRIPVLRSHGLSRDAYEAGAEHSGGDLYSTPMSEPPADVDESGFLRNSNRSISGGWVRGRGAPALSGGEEEDYGFLPEHDQE